MVAAVAVPAAVRGGDEPVEVVRYEWRMQGFSGALAGLFFPNQGQGSLTTQHLENGHLQSELLITAPASAKGEFWRYGAELDPATKTTVRAWSSYSFRGDKKSRESVVEGQGVMDIASGIYLLRQQTPRQPTAMRIWSDGKIYAVNVLPHGVEMRRRGQKSERLRHLSIVGADRPGERPWKGHLELWLTDDAAATPVEILIERKWASVRLEMPPDAGR
jgi:Protein of unknown function (DUF3108)